jgi:pantothenate kinase
MQKISPEDLAAILIARASARRIIVAIAGPPGVGKTTITEALASLINDKQPGLAAMLPMDGYHFDDIYLEQMGWRARKGAPHTFDVGGFAHMLGRLKANNENEVAVPVFDRSIEIARAGARIIPQSAKVIVADGNYLLLDDEPWDDLAPFFDLTVMLKASQETITQRLQDRWVKHGLPANEINVKLNDNDLPNVEMVINNSRDADYSMVTDEPDTTR